MASLNRSIENPNLLQVEHNIIGIQNGGSVLRPCILLLLSLKITRLIVHLIHFDLQQMGILNAAGKRE